MRILFTGATGFVGSNIRNKIETEGNEVLFLIAPGEKISPQNGKSKVIEADLKDIVKVRDKIKSFDPEACIHCAWQGIPDYSEEVSKINLDNSINLIDVLFKDTACKKLIVSGSCLEYGKTKGICMETENGDPSLFFSWAKIALYYYANLMAKNNGRLVIWFRMFYVYGPGQRKTSLIPSLVSSFRKRKLPKINNPFNANDFVYIEDVAEAFNIAVSNVIPSGIYNLGSGLPTKVIDICEIIERQVTGNSDITDFLRKNTNNEQKVNFWADTNKSREVLGWEYKTTIEEGIKKYNAPEGEQ